MKLLCECCEQWTSLPADGGHGKRPFAPCEHCSAPLQVDDRYARCSHCNSFYLAAYGVCPLCAHAVATVAAEASQQYSPEAQQRKSRDGHYYWQLYIDYQLQPADVPTEDATPAPPANGHAPSVSLNGHANGNGFAPSAPTSPGTATPAQSNGVGSVADTEANPKSKIQSPKS